MSAPAGEEAHKMESRGELATIATIASDFTCFYKGIIDDAAVFPFAMAAEDIWSVAKRGLVRGQVLDVSPNAKLATSWAAIKHHR